MGVFYSLPDCPKITVGRHYGNTLVIDSGYVSSVQFVITSDKGSVTAHLRSVGKNPLFINSIQLKPGEEAVITPSDMISTCGYVFVWLKGVIFADTELETAENECVRDNLYGAREELITSGLKVFIPDDFSASFHSPFTPAIRHNQSFDSSDIEIDAPPVRKAPEKASITLAVGPALTMAIPILIGCSRKISAAASLFAAIWAAANVLRHKRKLKEEERRRKNSYYAYIKDVRLKIKERLKDYVRILNINYPTVDKYLSDGGNPFIMWNKPVDAADRYMVRIGTGDRPLPIELKIPRDKFLQYDDSLRDLPGQLRDEFKVLSGLPVTIDIKNTGMIGIVYDDFGKALEVLAAFICEIAVNLRPDECRVVMELYDCSFKEELKRMRFLPHLAVRDGGEGDGGSKVNITNANESLQLVMITDSISRAAAFAGGDNVLVVILKSSLKELPAGADIVLKIDRCGDGIIHLKDTNSNISNPVFDRIGIKEAGEYARIISKLWGREDTGNADIPDKVLFGEIYRDKQICYESVRECYDRAFDSDNIAFPIGIESENRPVILDVSEKGNGPHGILCGSTGSGKSELLTTIILSAALCHPPDKLGFFLIDYKGGGMSNLFGRLPHLMGSISNLSPAESYRAMISIKSENIRRQKVFNENGVNNINDYQRLYHKGLVEKPLPHILIIIDEFAELKKEQPEFMQQLISVAQVGRSLGIHLLLATQKPAGIVDDKIRSNSKFRIALRVEDKADSMDMLHKPDASYITGCGRGYLQVGNDEIYTCFQSAYAMGKCVQTNADAVIYDSKMQKIAYDCRETDNDKQDKEITWYEYAMQVLMSVCGTYGGIRNDSLWLKSLPEKITASYCKLRDDPGYMGEADDPYGQCYHSIAYSCKITGNLLITGPPQSGKSSLVNTILAGILSDNTQQKPEIYITDMGGGMLETYSAAGFCGGCILPENIYRLPMLLNYLSEETDRRRRKRSDGREVICEKDEKPHSIKILVIDNVGECLRLFPEQTDAALTRILKYGRAADIYLILTSMGIGIKEMPEKYLKHIDSTVILGRSDPYAASSALKVSTREIPKIHDCPGRGLIAYEERPLEFQAAFAEMDRKEISCVIEENNKLIQQKAEAFPYVPVGPDLDDFLKSCGRCKISHVMENIPIGYDAKTGNIVSLYYRKSPCVIISGAKGSGRHTFMSNLSVTACIFGAKVKTAASARALAGIIREAGEENGSRGCCGDKFVRKDPVDIIQQSILITLDYDRIFADIYDNGGEEYEEILSGVFDNSLRKRRSLMIAGIMSDELRMRYRGRTLYEDLVRSPYVIYFGGALDEQRTFDVSYLPYSQQSVRKPPGGATVIKYKRGVFFGDLVTPAICREEEEYDD